MVISMSGDCKEKKQQGKQSICFLKPPCIIAAANVAGKKEGEGPLSEYFDIILQDDLAGKETWEEAESEIMNQAIQKLMEKADIQNSDIRYLIGGDLLGQLIATSFGVATYDIPLIGVYGACSTMGESMCVAAMLVEGGFADRTIAITSSHFAGAEKQFRFPLDYGNQRPKAATWTVTGSGAVVIGTDQMRKATDLDLHITGITIGKIVDYGIKDSMNMGAAMAPAACDTIYQHLEDFHRKPEYYDRIITGDLGVIGKEILIELLKAKGYDISSNHMDCGIEIFDAKTQDTHAGGSGCACSALTLTGYIMKQMEDRVWNRILFVPTGALLSTVSFNEGNAVPGIAHAVVIETPNS